MFDLGQFVSGIIFSPVTTLITGGITILTGGGVLGAFVFKNKDTIKNIFLGGIRKRAHDINDPNLKQAYISIMRYAFSQFPDAKDSEILNKGIEYMKRFTPNWILSDRNVEIVGKQIWQDIKQEGMNL